jgi:nicotinamidase-related amidase
MKNPAYSTDISALILIDVLNDFLSPQGKTYSCLAARIEKVSFIPNVTRLIAGARAASLQIVYAPHGLNEHSFDDMKYIPTRMVPATEHRIFWEGEFGDGLRISPVGARSEQSGVTKSCFVTLRVF